MDLCQAACIADQGRSKSERGWRGADVQCNRKAGWLEERRANWCMPMRRICGNATKGKRRHKMCCFSVLPKDAVVCSRPNAGAKKSVNWLAPSVQPLKCTSLISIQFSSPTDSCSVFSIGGRSNLVLVLVLSPESKSVRSRVRLGNKRRRTPTLLTAPSCQCLVPIYFSSEASPSSLVDGDQSSKGGGWSGVWVCHADLGKPLERSRRHFCSVKKKCLGEKFFALRSAAHNIIKRALELVLRFLAHHCL